MLVVAVSLAVSRTHRSGTSANKPCVSDHSTPLNAIPMIKCGTVCLSAPQSPARSSVARIDALASTLVGSNQR